MRKLTSELAAVALVLALGLPSSASSQSGMDWQVLVGRETDDHAIQAQAYFPIVITVVAGDAITWTLGGLNSHTVTFLSGQPPPVNPVVTPDGRSLPSPLMMFAQGGTSYDGTRFANSGILGTRANSYSLTFTTPGVYPYRCLIHRGMDGTVVVVPSSSRPPKSPAEYRTLGEQEWAVVRTRGEGLAQSAPTVEEAAPGGGTSYYISAGFGGNEASIIRFLPQELSIRVGDTVTWVQSDPQEIHTVTFPDADTPTSLFLTETPPLGPPVIFYDPAATQPQGGPVHRGQGYYNSGVMQPFARYTLTFLQPGTYAYICIPHANLGQVGTIVVQ
jgi:plastocyanin